MKTLYLPWWKFENNFVPPNGSASSYQDDTVKKSADNRLWKNMTNYDDGKQYWMPLDANMNLIAPKSSGLFVCEEGLTEKEIQKLIQDQNTKTTRLNAKIIKHLNSLSYVSYWKSNLSSFYQVLPYNTTLLTKNTLIAVYFPQEYDKWLVGVIIKITNKHVWVQFWGEKHHVKVFADQKTYRKYWLFVTPV